MDTSPQSPATRPHLRHAVSWLVIGTALGAALHAALTGPLLPRVGAAPSAPRMQTVLPQTVLPHTETAGAVDSRDGDDGVRATELGAVAGTVQDSRGAPIPAAVIRAERQGVMYLARSRADGQFRIVALPPGDYDLVVTRVGLGSTVVSVHVENAPVYRAISLPDSITTGRTMMGGTLTTGARARAYSSAP